MNLKSTLSPLQKLAAKWRVISQMLTQLARTVTMSHKQMSHGGARQGEMIEAQIYCALVSLSGIIAAYAVNEHRLSRTDREALMYLRTVYGLLGVIALMIRQLRTELEAAAERLAKLSGGFIDPIPETPNSTIHTFRLLDPG